MITLLLLAQGAMTELPLPGTGAATPSRRNAALLDGRPVGLTRTPGQLARLDPATGQMETFDLGAPIEMIGAAGDTLLLAATPEGTLLLLNSSLSVIGSLQHDPGDDVGAIPGTSRGYILCRSGQHVTFIDLGTMSPCATANFDREPTAVCGYDGFAFVTLDGGDVARVDPATGQTLQRVAVSPSPTDVAAAGGLVFVLDRGLGRLTALDAGDLEPVMTLDDLDDPASLHVFGPFAFVADSEPRVTVVDVDPTSPAFMKARAAITLNGAANAVVTDGVGLWISRQDRASLVEGELVATAIAPALAAIRPRVGPPGTRVTPDPGWPQGAHGILNGSVTEMRIPMTTPPDQTVRLGLSWSAMGTPCVSSPLQRFEVADTDRSLEALAMELRQAHLKQAAKRLEQARHHIGKKQMVKKLIQTLALLQDHPEYARRVVEILRYEAYLVLPSGQSHYDAGSTALDAGNLGDAVIAFEHCFCE